MNEAAAATDPVQGEPKVDTSTTEPTTAAEVEVKPDDSTKDGSEEPASGEEGERKKSGFARRAEKFHRQTEELAAELEYWKRTALGQAQAAPQQQPPSEPKLADYDSVEDYIRARDVFLEQKVLAKVNTSVQHRSASDRAFMAHEARVAKVKSELQDWDEVFDDAGALQVPPDAAQFVMESEVGPRIAYHLAKNPEELDRLTKLSPTRRLAELGKLEDRLAPKVAPPKKATSAPTKLTEVKGGADVAPSGRPSSYADWKARQEKAKSR